MVNAENEMDLQVPVEKNCKVFIVAVYFRV